MMFLGVVMCDVAVDIRYDIMYNVMFDITFYVMLGETEVHIDAEGAMSAALPMPSRPYEVYGSYTDPDGTTLETSIIMEVPH